MRRRQRQRGAHVLTQIGQGLPGQGIHDVQIEGVKRLGGLLDGGQRLRPVMDPPERFEKTIVEALHANRQARDPR